MSFLSAIGKGLSHTVGSLVGGLGSAVLGTASGAVNNAISNAQNMKLQKMQNQFNAQQQEKQNQFAEQQATTAYNRQVQFWNLQNAYNDPSQQITRMRNAGINPTLAYSQGGLNNVGAATPTVNQGSTNAPITGSYNGSASPSSMSEATSSIVNGISATKDLEVKDSQIAANKAAADAAVAKAREDNANARGKELENIINADPEVALERKRGFKGKYYSDYNSRYISDQTLNNLVLTGEGQVYANQFASDTFDSRKDLAFYDARLRKLQSSNQAVENRNQQRMIDANYKSILADIKLKQKQGLLSDAQAIAAYAQAEQLKQLAYYYGQMGNTQMLENEFNYGTHPISFTDKHGNKHYNIKGIKEVGLSAFDTLSGLIPGFGLSKFLKGAPKKYGYSAPSQRFSQPSYSYSY